MINENFFQVKKKHWNSQNIDTAYILCIMQCWNFQGSQHFSPPMAA